VKATGWTGMGFQAVKIADQTGRLHAPADFQRFFVMRKA
jgi:hypothetical protein